MDDFLKSNGEGDDELEELDDLESDEDNDDTWSDLFDEIELDDDEYFE
ncbi:MAG: hypothetical protein R3A44_30870 [Caldilineaceae bacterium]